MVDEQKAKIHYYCREKYYHAMQAAAVDGIHKFTTDTSFHLYNGLALILGGRVQEGIRELDPLQNDSDVGVAAVLSLIIAHRRLSMIDREAITKLDAKLKEDRKQTNENGLFYGALGLLLLGKPDKAREYINRHLQSNSKSIGGQALRGWIEIYAGREGKVKNASQYFDTALELSNNKNIDALLGKAKFCEMQNEFEEAISLLNKLIVQHPSFVPPLIEKMKNQLALFDWELALETSNRILSTDPHCLEAQKVKILSLVCKDGNYEEAGLSLHRYLVEMERIEPKNAGLFLETSQLFSRVCSRNPTVLSETYRFAEKAAQIDPSNAEYITELGYQCFLQGKLKEATRMYRNATKVDDSSVSALLGLTMCQLAEGEGRDQAVQQVEFLREVQGTQMSAELLLMSSQLVTNHPEKAVSYLNECVEIHFRALRTLSYGTTYLRQLDPDFLLQIVKEYLAYTPVQPAVSMNNVILSGQVLPAPLKQSLTVLEAITKACPGLLEGLHQLARVQLLSGDQKAAMSTLQNILDNVDATCSDAHLLMAQIYVQQKNFERASQSLEVGLSYNFKVRDHPLYHLISAIVKKNEGNVNECIKILKTALSIVNLNEGNEKQFRKHLPKLDLSLPDKVSLFLELADAYKTSKNLDEANKIMLDALVKFKDSSEEGRIKVAHSDLALERGDVKRALELLQNITPDQMYYQQSRYKMADIHIRYRKDRRAFAECFRELVENSPGSQSYVMLGDAYMSIQEPDRAIDAYEQALKRNPRDFALACKMGKALVKTHQYGKAINYYKEAVKSEENSELKLDMAELYMRLGQHDKAEKTLLQELDIKTDANDLQALIARTKVLLLLAKVREKSGNTRGALATLTEARDNQNRVLKRAAVDQFDKATEQSKIAAKICQQMADHATVIRDHGLAIQQYKEALLHNPNDKNILVALAKLYMQGNDLDQCQITCAALLKADADNEAATVMMADLAFRRVDFDSASYHFQQLLDRHPTYWTALARLVEVMRRTGQLEGIPPYLARAQAACQRANQEAGLSYCKGLYEWYSGNPNEALRQFNASRRDPEWGQQAIYNMIEICLNPDDESVGNDSFMESEDEGSKSSREMALRTAEKLLKELKPRAGIGGDEVLNHRLLSNFLLYGTRQKPNVEKALQDFTNIATQEAFKDHVGAALGLATGYMILKQTPRARNQLKRVAKSPWTFEDAEYLERCWLLLADIYIQNSKYDLASELLRRALQYNRACTKAYEYAGYIAEKEQQYREASSQYEKAWSFGGHSNPAIGYKLAFNYMKAKKYANAIDVCQQVLKLHPDYPRIRKEILDKSRNNIRT